MLESTTQTQPDRFVVTIRNCNNISEGTVEIRNGRLNLKYAPNGTGKSTIAAAIAASGKAESSLDRLTPFHLRGIQDPDEASRPSVDGCPPDFSVHVFDESYVDQFLFQRDELVQNSFEIFIKTDEYDERMELIEAHVADVRKTFTDRPELDKLRDALSQLIAAFGNATTGYSKAGSLYKGLGKGNKLEHIPPALTEYQEFLASNDNVRWIKWQSDGNDYADVTSKCPYCASDSTQTKERSLEVAKHFDPNTIKHLNQVLDVLDRLSEYFSPAATANWTKIRANVGSLTDEQNGFIAEIRRHVETLHQRLSSLKDIGFLSVKDVDEVRKQIEGYRVDLSFLPHLDSPRTRDVVDAVNATIVQLLDRVGLLQGEVNKQKRYIADTVRKHQESINEFLGSAGYPYRARMDEEDGGTYKLRLQHRDASGAIDSPRENLSFGERNAFALVMFMYDCLRRQPDLVILDDPVSSFDQNKKFAVLNFLFRENESFRGRTVLLLTHDFQPVIDLVRAIPRIFSPKPVVTFVRNRAGHVTEDPVTSDDVRSAVDVACFQAKAGDNVVGRLVHLRRYFELVDSRSHAYDVLSSLLHRRPAPTKHGPTEDGKPTYVTMSSEEVAIGIGEIRRYVGGFDYSTALSEHFSRDALLASYGSAMSNYERLQIYRLIRLSTGATEEDRVLKKFVDETYHIENDYLFQLDPQRFDLIPDWVVDQCTERTAELTKPSRGES